MTGVPRTFAALAVSAGLVAGGAWLFTRRTAEPVATYETTKVRRGDLVARISATGTLEPEEVVDVGAQVAGQILSFGKDEQGKPIDYGSAVRAGTVLARIDNSLYALDVAQAQSTLAQAQASVQRAEADLGQMRAKLNQADNDWKRAQTLGPGNALAQTSYDAYKAGYEAAAANLAVGEATVVQSKAAVVQAQEALQRAQRNLGYCTITSPVDGVIIDRRVNIGQTVVSSLSAPSLFLIARDLKRMQVWVSVNEADIGSIHPGEPVAFTVDARPGQTFHGTVLKTRLNATMTQNVVAYTVEVGTDNSTGVLLPYLTANVQFEVARRTGVLVVSNDALRYSPTPQQIAPGFRGRPVAAGSRDGTAAGASSTDSSGGELQGRPGILWVKAADGLRPLEVRTGLTDGRRTEVRGDGLAEGLEVVVRSSQPADTAPAADANPFTPQFGRGQGGRGSR
jgi:HlyD family secretion protein